MGTFTMEPVAVPGRISGAAIIDDLCNRIAEKLSRGCDLRQTDSYSSYSARVTVELSLVDVDTTQVSQQITVGNRPEPARTEMPFERITPQYVAPPQRIAVDVATVQPEAVLGFEPELSLERTVDGSEREPHSAPPKASRRYYTPRGITHGARPK